jgi:hypothetical protein
MCNSVMSEWDWPFESDKIDLGQIGQDVKDVKNNSVPPKKSAAAPKEVEAASVKTVKTTMSLAKTQLIQCALTELKKRASKPGQDKWAMFVIPKHFFEAFEGTDGPYRLPVWNRECAILKALHGMPNDIPKVHPLLKSALEQMICPDPKLHHIYDQRLVQTRVAVLAVSWGVPIKAAFAGRDSITDAEHRKLDEQYEKNICELVNFYANIPFC